MPSLLKPLPGSILDKHCCELSLGQASQYLPPPFLNSMKEIQIYQPKLDGANMAALASSSHLVRWEMCVLPFPFPFLYRLFPIQTFQGDIPWGISPGDRELASQGGSMASGAVHRREQQDRASRWLYGLLGWQQSNPTGCHYFTQWLSLKNSKKPPDEETFTSWISNWLLPTPKYACPSPLTTFLPLLLQETNEHASRAQ